MERLFQGPFETCHFKRLCISTRALFSTSCAVEGYIHSTKALFSYCSVGHEPALLIDLLWYHKAFEC